MKTSVLSKILTITLLFISISVFGLTPEETKKARKTWLKGYESYEKGEKALENEKFRESHAFFKESLDIFNGIKTQYPGWSSSMIDYRIKLCNSKMVQVKVQLDKNNIKITDNDVDKENLLLKRRVTSLSDELKKIKRKLSITLTSLENARREAARNINSSDEMEKLVQEKTDLEKKYALLLERNRKLQMETGTVSVETAEESKKALDAALLEMEALKGKNKQILAKLKKEQDRFVNIARENTQLRYDNKIMFETDKKTKSLMKNLNGKISEHNEIVKRWELEKTKFGKSLNETQKILTQKDAKIKELQEKLDDIRDNPGEDTVTKQLENENELLLKDIEVVNLQFAKELREKKKVIEDKNQLLERVGRIEKALASALQVSNKSKDDLITLEKKTMVSDTIIKKQDKVIADQKAANEKLQKELQQIVDKYKNIDKKEKEFIALANDSLKVENENRMLKTDLTKLKVEKEKLTNEVKKSEVRSLQLQKEIEKIIADNLKKDKRNFNANEEFRSEIISLNEKVKGLKSQLETGSKKVKMMTEELIAVNSLLTKKEKTIETMNKEKEKNDAILAQINNVKEPELAPESVEYTALKKENKNLNEKLKVLAQELAKLKANNVVVAEVDPTGIGPGSGKKKIDKKEIKKMLGSAASAEENNKREAASWYYEKVLELDPNNNTALSRLGYIHTGNGNYEEAIGLLTRGLKSEPDDVDKLQVLTVCYIREKKFNYALGTASKANAVNPKNPITLRYLGIIYSNLDFKDAAEKQFRESFKIDPTSSETALNSAVLLSTIKDRLGEAKLWYNKAIDLGAERDPGIEKIIKTAE